MDFRSSDEELGGQPAASPLRITGTQAHVCQESTAFVEMRIERRGNSPLKWPMHYRASGRFADRFPRREPKEKRE